MQLEPGDRLLVTGQTTGRDSEAGEAGYVCRILTTRGPDGGPPYQVLRYDTGQEQVLDPNPELSIRVLAHASV